MFKVIRNVTADWRRLTRKIRVPFWVVQHGDLHGGNVLVDQGQLSFIDLARFGPWPVGYDMCRLATHARIHLPWQERDRDWIEHDLQHWVLEEFAGIDPDFVSHVVCDFAATTDRAFAGFVNERPVREHGELCRLYAFCALSDLLRILSYTTLSHFKRIWVAIAIWQLAGRLGFPRKG